MNIPDLATASREQGTDHTHRHIGAEEAGRLIEKATILLTSCAPDVARQLAGYCDDIRQGCLDCSNPQDPDVRAIANGQVVLVTLAGMVEAMLRRYTPDSTSAQQHTLN